MSINIIMYRWVLKGLLLGEAWLLLKGVLLRLANGLLLAETDSCREVFLSVVDNFLLTSLSMDLKLSCLSTPSVVGILVFNYVLFKT